MENIKLSICIPTYNFGAFIGETLESIVSQASTDIEIVVVDGASTDSTPDVVQRFAKRFDRLRYYRLLEKGGVDRDMAQAVELSQGDYCWLMSADDVLKPGAINRVLHEIDTSCGIYLCNRTECDRDLRPIRDQRWLSQTYNDHLFYFSTKLEWMAYFEAAISIGALFSYISAIVFNRKKWNEIRHDEVTNGTNYAHVFRLFSMLKEGATLKYIKAPLVLCRGGNDSFLSNGIANRYLIDLNGYQLLATRLFFDDAEMTYAFLGVMQREHPWFMLISLRARVNDIAIWSNMERRLLSHGYAQSKLTVVRILGGSPVIVVVARWLWGLLRGIKRVINESLQCKSMDKKRDN